MWEPISELQGMELTYPLNFSHLPLTAGTGSLDNVLFVIRLITEGKTMLLR